VSVSIRSGIISRTVGAVAALSMCAAGAAWAGDGGGADFGSLASALTTFCGFYLPSSLVCPQGSTITQDVLQLAAWYVVPTEMVRATNAIPIGNSGNAGNPSSPFVEKPPPITSFPVLASTLSNQLPNLMPLAFVSSAKTGTTAAATQLYDPEANRFFYATASAYLTDGTQPDTLFLFYDDPQQIINIFPPGQVIAKISFPLAVLTGYGTASPTETPITTTLQIVVPSKPPTPGSGVAVNCSASTVSGSSPSGSPVPVSFSSLPVSDIGVNCAVVFAASPISPVPHAIYEVAVPLIVTMATDPLSFSDPANVVIGSPFTSDLTFPQQPSTGFTSASFPSGTKIPNKSYIGVPPSVCAGATCPASTATYPLCANLPGLIGSPVPSVAAYYAIATNGETLLSAPLPGFTASGNGTGPLPVCPF
jgi:hypothetical protein